MPVAVKPFKVGTIEVGGGDLFLIAGPCLVESESHALKMAHAIRSVADRLGISYIFKSSYDKANRTSISSERGIGIETALRILGRVRDDAGVSVLTDVHEASQVRAAAEVADVLQIPAFLSRQTDLIVEAARSGRAVNIKKGQFLAPHDMKHAIEKATSQGTERVMITERGTSFGYNNLVVDFRGVPIMRAFGYPVVHDVTHSLQRPGGLGSASGGDSQFIEYLARAGVACGVDGVFMEVHDDPAHALSDGPNSLPLDRLEPLLEKLRAIHELVRDVLR
ncbi:MAG: 3-deoxy-8-phosphooctulonate synthase [Cyanobacteria bacterium 13_1_40CM_2_61_4]|nr:MAG: 3-deoxy-8-phosphooctulonate synthase [Cyanobacteria bacterium 13_1_40CM_2_61_4]